MNNIRHKYLLSWQIPLIGFGLTFFLGLGFSYSNQDIRSKVQIVGLAIFTVLVAIGSYYTVRAFRFWQRYKDRNYLKQAIAGLLANLLLIFFTITSIRASYAMNHPANITKHSVTEFKPSLNAPKLPIWIDTDPACSQGATNLDKLTSGDQAAQWLRQVSQSWMSFWEDHLHQQGFHPFDALAVGYVTMPDLFGCEILPAHIGFSIFLEPFGLGRDLEVAQDIKGSQVYYCSDVDQRFKDRLIQRLITPRTLACLDNVSPEELINALIAYSDGHNNNWKFTPTETRHL